MARVTIPVHEMDKMNEAYAFEISDAGVIDTAEGAEIDYSARDDKMVVIMTNSGGSAAKVTVKAGNGIQGVNDLEIEVQPDASAVLTLESGRFKNVSGPDKGKVIMTSDADGVGVMAFKLP